MSESVIHWGLETKERRDETKQKMERLALVIQMCPSTFRADAYPVRSGPVYWSVVSSSETNTLVISGVVKNPAAVWDCLSLSLSLSLSLFSLSSSWKPSGNALSDDLKDRGKLHESPAQQRTRRWETSHSLTVRDTKPRQHNKKKQPQLMNYVPQRPNKKGH